MHDAARVRVAQRPSDLAQPARGVARWDGATGLHALGECFAIDEGHNEIDEAIDLVDGVHRHDVRMREAGRETSFAEKAFTRRGIAREGRRQQLDGHQAVEMHFAREVDHAHPPASELAVEGVTSGERLLEVEEEGVGGDGGHCAWTTGRSSRSLDTVPSNEPMSAFPLIGLI